MKRFNGTRNDFIGCLEKFNANRRRNYHLKVNCLLGPTIFFLPQKSNSSYHLFTCHMKNIGGGNDMQMKKERVIEQ